MPRSTFSPLYARFRELLVQSRKDAGLTQVELAELLKRRQSFVSKYETGERRLDLIEFLEVAQVLQVDVHAFIRELQGE
jgi:transcriptional regulator with XRE-family HTH domain